MPKNTTSESNKQNIKDTLRSSIDRKSYLPFYVQVKESLREPIEQGLWKPGDQIPGEADLCELFEVSRTVVRQALNELVHEGLIARMKGKGTFVAEPKIREGLMAKLTGFYQDMVDRGLTPVTQVLTQEVIPANATVAGHLNLELNTPVIVIERLRFIQDEPILFVKTHLPYHLCPKLAQTNLTNQSLYAFLENECGLVITRGHRSIEAIPADEYQAKLLRVPIRAPLISLNSISFLENGTPLEYYHALHRGDRSRFEVELVRVREQGGGKRLIPSENEELNPSYSNMSGDYYYTKGGGKEEK